MNKDNIEHRTVETALEVRADENGNREIVGLGIPFDKPSLPIGGDFIEYIDRDAFDEQINGDAEIMLLYSHQWSEPLARRSAGRLKIEKRADGIYYTATPPDTTRAQDLLKDIEAGNIKGNSFGFTVEKDEWTQDKESGVTTRRVLRGTLYEISPVVMPAYPDTTIAKRSFEAATKSASAKNKLRKARLRLLQLKTQTNYEKEY